MSIYPLSLHDALPISHRGRGVGNALLEVGPARHQRRRRSEEHTSELQSLTNLVCRLLLEKKKFLIKRAHVFSVQLERRIDHPVADREVVALPAKTFRI